MKIFRYFIIAITTLWIVSGFIYIVYTNDTNTNIMTIGGTIAIALIGLGVLSMISIGILWTILLIIQIINWLFNGKWEEII